MGAHRGGRIGFRQRSRQRRQRRRMARCSEMRAPPVTAAVVLLAPTLIGRSCAPLRGSGNATTAPATPVRRWEVRSLVRRRTLHTFAAFAIGLACLKRSARHCASALMCDRLDGMQEALSALQTTVTDLRREQRELFESGGAAPRPAVNHVGRDAGSHSPVPPAPPAPPQQAALIRAPTRFPVR